MTPIKTVVAEIASALEGALPWQVSPYLLGAPTPPTVEVYPDPDSTIDYDYTGSRGIDELGVVVRAVTPWADDRAAQDLLYEMLEPEGDRSVKQIVQSAEIDGCRLHVYAASGFREYVREGWQQPGIGVEWRVRVYSS